MSSGAFKRSIRLQYIYICIYIYIYIVNNRNEFNNIEKDWKSR